MTDRDIAELWVNASADRITWRNLAVRSMALPSIDSGVHPGQHHALTSYSPFHLKRIFSMSLKLLKGR